MTNTSELARAYLETGRSQIPIIDAHTHMGANYGTSLSIATADEMIALMDRENVACAFTSPHSALFDPSAMNRELEDAMSRFPGRFYGYFTFNPNYADRFNARLGDILTIPGYLGIKLLPGYHRYDLDGPAYDDVLDFALAHELPVLSHTWGELPYNAPKNAEGVLKKRPKLRLIMGHTSPGEAEAAITLAKTYPNIYLDLCDIHRHNGIVDRLVNAVGADRVLFGTDMPWYDPNYCLGSILFSRISDADKEKIIYKNAKTLLDSVPHRRKA